MVGLAQQPRQRAGAAHDDVDADPLPGGHADRGGEVAVMDGERHRLAARRGGAGRRDTAAEGVHAHVRERDGVLPGSATPACPTTAQAGAERRRAAAAPPPAASGSWGPGAGSRVRSWGDAARVARRAGRSDYGTGAARRGRRAVERPSRRTATTTPSGCGSRSSRRTRRPDRRRTPTRPTRPSEGRPSSTDSGRREGIDSLDHRGAEGRLHGGAGAGIARRSGPCRT